MDQQTLPFFDARCLVADPTILLDFCVDWEIMEKTMENHKKYQWNIMETHTHTMKKHGNDVDYPLVI